MKGTKVRWVIMGNNILKELIPRQMKYILDQFRFKSEIQQSKKVKEMLSEFGQYNNNEIEEFRIELLKNILCYSDKYCQYYREVFKENSFDPRNLSNFNKIPFLDKEIIRKNYKKLVSASSISKKHFKMNTGGSTGQPLDFIVSNLAGFIDSAHQEFQYIMMGYEKGDLILAFDGSTVPQTKLERNIFWVNKYNWKGLPYGKISYSSLYLTDENIHFYIDDIIKRKPVIMRGYPSFINTLAEYIISKDIKINFRIKGIELTSEMAHESQIRNIENAFNAPVYMQYGHSEVCAFAFTKKGFHTKYYFSPFYGHVEIVDTNGNHVNEGEIGEIVVTGFYNYAMPFIRYKTGDLAEYGGKENGLVCVNRLLGRTQDYVYSIDGKKTALTALIFGQHYRAFGNIKEWQIVQAVRGKVKVRVVKTDDFNQEDQIEIKEKFLKLAGVDVEFEYMDNIPRTARGKYKFLIQDCY